MRTEEDGGIQLAKEKLRLAKEGCLEFECKMQEVMDNFIEEKIPLQLDIEALIS